MKKIIFFLIMILSAPTFADNCFIAVENNKIIKREGDCKARHSPYSTFKIAISLMGYNEGILLDEEHPKLPFKAEYPALVESWKNPQNPTTWIKNSCVWYSQFVTQKLGAEKFQEYVTKFNYGNKNISGDFGKNNGLTRSWLSSSLKISAEEQIQFLQKLLDNKLPVNKKSQELTKNILFVEALPNGWKLYGKTGAGDIFKNDGSPQNCQAGWFIGWIAKENKNIIFANYIEDKNNKDYSSGKLAKEGAKERLKLLEEY